MKTKMEAKALGLAVKEYCNAVEAKETVDVIRSSSGCSSPAHTALSIYLSGHIDQLRSLIFSMSGFDYEFLEDVEAEAGKLFPDFDSIVDAWLKRDESDGEGK